MSGDGRPSIREGLLFTEDGRLTERIRRTVVHWPLEIAVRDRWTGWQDVPEDCRLILFDRSTIGGVELSDNALRLVLSGSGEDLVEALESFLFLREPFSVAVGIEHLLHVKCRQYLSAVGSLREAGSAYSFFVSLLDRLLLPGALEVAQGNQHRASRILGISRNTFRNKMKLLDDGDATHVDKGV
ncbi:MAG: helix-turn-helix domain-containing protein [Leptospirillia bacterium]